MPKPLRRLRTAIRLWSRRRDPDTAIRILQRVASRILPQYRFKHPQMQWWLDPEFTAYLERFEELDDLNADRRWMVKQLLRLVADVPGDTAECGVWRGAGSYLICQANASASYRRVHHMFDSFRGLSEPGAADGDSWAAGDMASPEKVVMQALQEFGQQLRCYAGWIPERFEEVADRRFAFVHVDVDLYEPTRESVRFFYPRLNNGAILICDDYGFTTCPGSTRAVDEVLRDAPESMVSLSGGGGFLIKGTPTTA